MERQHSHHVRQLLARLYASLGGSKPEPPQQPHLQPSSSDSTIAGAGSIESSSASGVTSSFLRRLRALEPLRLGGIELDSECQQRNSEGVCTACQQEDWVVDAQTQHCRPKKCTELDSLCQACNEQNLCSACWLPRYYAVDPQTHKCRMKRPDMQGWR